MIRRLLMTMTLALLPGLAKAETYSTKFNPFTGKLDFVTVVTSNTLPAGSTQYLANIPVLDEGVLQGGATTFNFLGSAIECTVTGKTANCTVTATGGGGQSLALRLGNSFVTITTAIADGDAVFQIVGGTGVWKVDLSTANTRLDNLDNSTATITTALNSTAAAATTRFNTIATDTATIVNLVKTSATATTIGFNNVASATATLTTALNSTAAVQTTKNAEISASTSSLFTTMAASAAVETTKFNNVASATATLTTALNSTAAVQTTKNAEIATATSTLFTTMAASAAADTTRFNTIAADTATIVSLLKATASATTIGFNDVRTSTTNLYIIITDTLAFLANSGHVINQSTNMVSWANLKDVPAGFADGTDNEGVGGAESDPAFNLFQTTGQPKIEAAGGFVLFNSTAGNILDLLKATATAATNDFLNLHSATATQLSLLKATASAATSDFLNLHAATATQLSLLKATATAMTSRFIEVSDSTTTLLSLLKTTAAAVTASLTGGNQVVLFASGTFKGSITSTSPAILGDLSAWTTVYTPFSFPFFVGVSSAIKRSTDTVGPSKTIFEANLSTPSQFAWYEIVLPPGVDSVSDPVLVSAVSVSTGVDPHPHLFSVQVASIGYQALIPNNANVIWTSTFIITTSSGGAASPVKQIQSPVSLTTWDTIGETGNRILYIRVINVSSSSTCQRYFHSGIIAWRRRT